MQWTMKPAIAVILVTISSVRASKLEGNPIAKVVELMDGLAAKIQADGEKEKEAYNHFSDWCNDASKNYQFSSKSVSAQKSKLEAKIAELSSRINVADSKIEQLVSVVATEQGQLKNATEIREADAENFRAGETELMEVMDTLGRAVGILQKEQATGASFAQLDKSSLPALVQSIGAVVDAAGFSNTDSAKLLNLVQTQASDSFDDSDDDTATPPPKAFSGGIVETLENLKDQAELKLSEARKSETKAKHNYGMLKQGLGGAMKAHTEDLDGQKVRKAGAAESKATAEGDLSVTAKALATDEEGLRITQSDCVSSAADFETTTRKRAEELKVIAEAKKTLVETTSGAAEQAYSLLQVSSGARGQDAVAKDEVLNIIGRLAKDKGGSPALAQLQSKITAVLRFGSRDGADVFGKVKSLILDMLKKLENEAAGAVTENEFCDTELSKTDAKKAELDEDLAATAAKLDQSAARVSQLKEQVKELLAELADLAKSQGELDNVRKQENEAYLSSTGDLKDGLAGVRRALNTLRDYYANDSESDSAALLQDGDSESDGDMSFMSQPAKPQKFQKATGAGSGIMGVLEVVEDDFAKGLSAEETMESDAQSSYEQAKQQNKVAKTQKQQDEHYKIQEVKKLEKAISDVSGDKTTASEERDAVSKYLAQLKDRCVAKLEPFAERKARRETELEGLKQALTILGDETALAQTRKGRAGQLRGGQLTADVQ